MDDGLRPGQIAMVSMDNAGFYNRMPRGSADPDKLLRSGSQVKVVAREGSYLKVELDDGNVGYVPAIMVDDPASSPSPGEVQVYPPLPGAVPIVPLEPADPNDPLAPSPEELPAVIEPEPEPATATDTPPPPPPMPDDLTAPAPPIRSDEGPAEAPPEPAEEGAEEGETPPEPADGAAGE